MRQVRIVLTGSECTGKTTLASDLSAHYGVTPVPEYLREYFEFKNGVLTIEDAIPIAEGQIRNEISTEKAGNNPLICDTNALSSIIYSRHYYGHCPQWIEQQLKDHPYHLYLLCETDIPWQADGQRDRPAEREHMQSLFRNELLKRKLPFVEISGDRKQRLDMAVRAVDRIL